jgi:T5SS/PEP-CTERM-associated repeat protein
VTGALKLGNAFEASAGTVNIDNGGSMNVSGQTSIGAAGFGRMQLRNGSDFRTTSSLLVGELGHGELDIGTGAVVTCGNCSIGEDASAPGGSAVVDGPGSALNATSTISVGTNTVGVLSVSNGAIVKTGISSAFTIGALGSVTLDGGVISAGNFVRNASGQFAFNAGTLLLTGTTFDLTNDLINSGSPRLTAGHTVKSTGGLTVNTAPLVMDGGALLGTTLTVGLQGTLLLANPASNVSMSSVVTDNGLIRGNGAIGASAVIINASGELRAGATDQLTLTSPIVTNNGQINLFGGLISASGTLTNASTGRISGRGVLDAGTTGNSGTISLTSGISDVFGTVTNNSGARVIAAGNALATFYGPVTNAAGSNFQVSAGSTVVFLGNVSGLGAFTGTGIKDFQGGANVGASLDSGGDSIVGGNALLSATHVREHALVVDGRVVIPPNGTGAGTSRLNTLTIDGNTTPTGTLELNDNDLLVDYAAAGEPSPLPTVQSQIVFARHGGAWDRPGITSAAAATQVAHATTLGIMEGSSFRQIYGPTATFSGGQSVDDTSILVKYSWYGDSDFNGTVNFDDYVRIDNGFNNHLSGWVNGDFDLNGAVNFDDYVLIDLAFNTQSGTLGRALSFLDGSDRSDDGMSEPALRRARQHFEQFGSDYANHFLAAVPEPTGAAGVVAMSLHALRRRRRALRV